MAASPAIRVSGSGRQAAEVEQQRDLLDELRAQTHENRIFAERVAASADELGRAVILERWDVVENIRRGLGYHAGRQVTRLGSVVL
ncbi:MAG TPA: hypothetical protein VFI34_07710 [Candidatus Limnocylindrales bacterium]|nr:hypothetical protein [Candidatus Limnocylindrales bacterium]